MGFANTAVEGAILGLMGSGSPYGNGKARLNFNWYIDEKGKSHFGGEGDVLWPLYDSLHTTIYTQFGARSMYGGGEQYGPDRWIGNIGLGQRWFPGASVTDDGTVDSGNFMFGYNAFYDHDISRGHQRGGVGVEAQYDWFKVASNWYLPISDWKDSKDFDGNFVQERAAQGWDIRAKGYLPFYREIALTGSFTQWYGENVGMFGPSTLEKDPKVWSYGVEYTPVPALTAYVNQRQSERGRSDTELGLRFTYNFGLSAEDQFKSARVAEMRTVHGSRHDFVDRENKIILEYKAKDKYRIEYVGIQGNAFVFRLWDGFNKHALGQTMQVRAGGGITLAEAPEGTPTSLFASLLHTLSGFFSVSPAFAADIVKTYTTGADGIIRVTVQPGVDQLDYLTLQAGETTQEFTRTQLGLGPKPASKLEPTAPAIGNGGSTTITITKATPHTAVAWSATGPGTLSNEQATTNASGTATATLTANATGSGDIVVKATVDGKDYSCTVQVGDVPLTITITNPLPNATKDAAYSQTLAASGGMAPYSFTVTTGTLPAGLTLATDGTLSGTPTAAVTSTFTVTVTDSASPAATATKELSLTVAGGGGATLTIDAFTNGPDHSNGVSTASVTALVKDGSGAALSGQTVTWSVLSASNTSPAIASGWGSKKTGLAWGSSHSGVGGGGGAELNTTQDSTATDTSGKTTQQISDIVGERTVTLRASVTISGTAYTVDQAVTFGDGPLKVFKAPEREAKTWVNAYNACNSSAYTGDPTTWTGSIGYVGGPNMPSRAELLAVSAPGSGGGLKGAGFAAGWSYGWYWTGEADGPSSAVGVHPYNGSSTVYPVGDLGVVVCRR